MADEFELIEEGIRAVIAAMWDSYYGKGIAITYVQTAAHDGNVALAALARLRVQVVGTGNARRIADGFELVEKMAGDLLK